MPRRSAWLTRDLARRVSPRPLAWLAPESSTGRWSTREPAKAVGQASQRRWSACSAKRAAVALAKGPEARSTMCPSWSTRKIDRTVARAGSGRSASVRRRGRGERPPGRVEGLGETAPSVAPAEKLARVALRTTRRPRRSSRRSAAGAERRSAPQGRGSVTPTGPRNVGRAARRRRKRVEGRRRPERQVPMDQSHQVWISWCPKGDTPHRHTVASPMTQPWMGPARSRDLAESCP